MNELTQKTAVVIGGASGVGKGVALSLAKAGANVVVADLDNEAVDSVKNELLAYGKNAIAVQVDATDTSSLDLLVKQITQDYQNVHILINTVGVVLERELLGVTPSDWSWIWKLNVMSQINSVNAFLPLLKQVEDGHIILTASGAGFVASPKEMKIGAYSTSKHALVGYAKNLQNELQGEGIKVSLLCPSGVEGNLASNSAKSYEQATGKEITDFGGKQPDNRILEDASVMGDMVVNALHAYTFLIGNKKSSIFEAIDKERLDILGK